jgi:putative phosphoribosyl transferase
MDARRFRDRQEAGEALAEELPGFARDDVTVVYGLARGGVPVAAVVAEKLELPLDVIVVRKVGAPGNPELAVGAITSVGGMVVNERVMSSLGLSHDEVDELARAERAELESQESEIRGDHERIDPAGKTAILVDDGLATGASMAAATRAVRESGASRVVVGVPVASDEAVSRVRELADAVHCLMTPAGFSAVGQWYYDFGQTSNAAVRELLEQRR